MADPLNRPPTLPDPLRVLAFSARDPEALAEMRHRLAGWLENAPDSDPDDVAFTLHSGRERFPCRDAVVGASTDELARLLREETTTGPCPVPTPGDGPVLLLLDGLQAVDAVPDLRAVADALRLAEDAGRATTAARTVAVQYGVVAWLRARGVAPRAVRGEGLGALAAAAARGDLPLTDALRAAAAGAPVPADEAPLLSTGEGEDLAAAASAGTLVVRIGAPLPDTTDIRGLDVPDVLVLDPADGASYARLLAELWRRGFEVDTTLGRPGRRVRLPGHPFRRREPGGSDAAGAGAATRPLTPYEQRWLFYDLVRHGSSGDHNVAVATVLPGPVPPDDVLSAGFAELQRRHPALRTVFSEPGGRWQARTLPAPAARPERLVADPDSGPQELRETVHDAARRSFPLRDEPLVRCCVQSGAAHWALSLGVYEPLTASVEPRQLLDELLALVGVDAPDRSPLPEPA